MIKKKFKFNSRDKTNMHISVKLFDTKLQMEDYKYNNWALVKDKYEHESMGYFKSLIYTKVGKNGKEKVRKKIGEIALTRERITIELIAHECLHAVIYFYDRCGVDFNKIKNDELVEEDFCNIHQQLFFDVLEWIKENNIEIWR